MTSWRPYAAAVSGALTLSIALVLVSVTPASAFSVIGPGGAVKPPAPKSTIDRTVTVQAKTSATYRKTIPESEWVASHHALYVINRESHGNCKAVSPSGAYRGKWQLGASFWSAHGGTAYAPRADLATCAQQDVVAYRGWLASWWSPWGG